MCFIRDPDKLCTCVFYVAKFVKKKCINCKNSVYKYIHVHNVKNSLIKAMHTGIHHRKYRQGKYGIQKLVVILFPSPLPDVPLSFIKETCGSTIFQQVEIKY